MSLKERLQRGPSLAPAAADVGGHPSGAYAEIKTRIHGELVASLDLSALDKLAPLELQAELRRNIEHLAEAAALPLNRIERERRNDHVHARAIGQARVDHR